MASVAFLGHQADVVAHHVLELLRTQLAVLVTQSAVLREAHEVRRCDVDAGVEVLQQVDRSQRTQSQHYFTSSLPALCATRMA